MELKKLMNFKKEEKLIVFYVFLFVAVLSLMNFRIALRKARDYQRKYDINRIIDALEIYREEFAFYPPSSENGKIIACKKQGATEDQLLEADSSISFEEKLLSIFRECEWGEDPLRDVTDPDYPSYLELLPIDPKAQKGTDYLYISNVSYFQLYGALEGKSEPEYKEGIEKRGLECGSQICNFGKTLEGVPLDKSLEEFMVTRMESE